MKITIKSQNLDYQYDDEELTITKSVTVYEDFIAMVISASRAIGYHDDTIKKFIDHESLADTGNYTVSTGNTHANSTQGSIYND